MSNLEKNSVEQGFLQFLSFYHLTKTKKLQNPDKALRKKTMPARFVRAKIYILYKLS